MVDDLQENEDIGPSSNIPSNSSPSIHSKINLDDLPSDPANRPPITSYHPDQIDDVRRAYLVKKNFSTTSTKFEKAYCLCCYLFNGSVGNQGGREVFVSGGFCKWSKPGALKEHVEEVNSVHINSVQKCDNLLNQKRSYEANVTKHSNEEKDCKLVSIIGFR
ncbi:uncharacterized protein LOC143636810 [Bidens hawaiensis]|uniref:uncharacterized protein LOC143636810 n=1 Tax=Bidens hawaiensis TaxID=980011 RepID=UPI00404B531D